MRDPIKERSNRLSPYLSPLGAWALSIGCAVGWGSFVMPGNTFLPIAGPLGSVLGLFIGGLVIWVIGLNYHFLLNRFPDAGGTFTYAKNMFGYDHGFLCAWFLVLTYLAVLWANATALPLILRQVVGSFFQAGPSYVLMGQRIFLGEVLLAISATILCTLLCLRRSLGQWAQIFWALVLTVGVAACFFLVWSRHQGGLADMAPAFSPENPPAVGLFNIIALAPWAFVGFESITHSVEEFRFPVKKSGSIFLVSLLVGSALYSLLVILAASTRPDRFENWVQYLHALPELSGVESMPTFHAAYTAMGDMGVRLLALAALGGIFTGLLGNIIAASRILYSMSRDDLLPHWMGKLDRNHNPRNAILTVLAMSAVILFFGRTAIVWIVDVTTVGAVLVYAYTSAAALKCAKQEKNKFFLATGWAGVVISAMFLLFFLVPNLLSTSTLSPASYLILAAWSLLGFLVFRQLCKADTHRRLGRSTVVWVVLLALIIFTSTVWVRQETAEAVSQAAAPIQRYLSDPTQVEELFTAQRFLLDLRRSLTLHTLIQTGLIVAALVILFSVYSLQQQRERQIEMEKTLAEESSRAKTSFLSNMSHEIRTPMNAIIGLDNLALKDPSLSPRTREQLEKIGSSAKHLLGLINDILDMSRIESGRMSLKEEEFDFRDFLDQINVMVGGQCSDRGLEYECNILGLISDFYIGDDMKLKQILINLLGNAVKFTNPPGSVTLTVAQTASFERHCTLRFVVKDTGVGMSKEFLPKIFDAFSQEDSGAANRFGSTGLGMAITKNYVQMMNGDIAVESEKGVGTTFTVTVTLRSSSRSAGQESSRELPAGLRLLVVDDDEVACEHARTVAAAVGITADCRPSGPAALTLIRARRDAGLPFHVVLTDYNMPGMDGIAFTRALREMDHGETAVIVLTGYSWDDIQEEAQKAGVDGILSKPLFTNPLVREIHMILQQRANASSPQEPVVVEQEEESTNNLKGCRLLIAEDMDINAEILIELLELEGISTDRAENGQVAVELFSSHPTGTYDAILMDVRMPVMDGLAATRAIRALDHPDAATVPIIAMTANAFEEDVQRSLQAGMTAHLSKPVEPNRLFETLNRLVKPKN